MLLPIFVIVSLIEYLALEKAPEVLRPVFCRNCNCRNSFWKHGSYWRVIQESGLAEKVRIQRFICSACGKTVSRPLGFVVPYREYSTAVIEEAIMKYVLARTSYRKIAKEFCANDQGDLLPPCHIQIFNWVKHFVEQSGALVFKLQEDMGLLGLFKEIESMPIGSCPNADKAHTKLKANQLNESVGVLKRLRIIWDKSADKIESLQAYFFKRFDNCKAILSGRPLPVATPQSNEHINSPSHISSQLDSHSGRHHIERERSPGMGAIPFRSDCSDDSSEPGKSGTTSTAQGSPVSPPPDARWN